ncbi:MAG TPA: D-alanine--D-alanine ligase [Verrucomicrobiae bacterium]|jgi:D-alanine-D-alanine ligase|nr:D-alanine--D-alanine ligase [Verrucomicrobiae bacterium]
MKKTLNITVMLGGPSAEREVSLRSGAAVGKALRALGHIVHELDPKEPGWSLPAGTDVVFLALHGSYGEDGTVQEELEKLGVPYTGCGPEASRLAFDKVLTKRRCVAAGVPTPRSEIFENPNAAWPSGWNPPVVLKPVRQGSSIGLQFVDKIEQWKTALAEAFRFDSKVLMEEKIEGRETTVGILGDRALPVVEICVKQGAFDYKNKYTPGAAEHFCPADFDAATTARIQAAALGAFRAVGGRDYARVDVMVRRDTEPLVLEVNTLPGMTEVSVLPDAAAAAGFNFPQLCQRMVDMAMERTPKK